jgi:asparagine synthase (glutamine-hydrolysing)
VCGIAGLVAADPADTQEVIAAQLRCLHHRGPDAAGSFPGGRGVIAQNRLAIIDLVTGDPPIVNEDRSIGAVLNGEIYNFRELRAELRAAGHDLRSRGDTEVIAHLAEDADAATLAGRLDGMFAFAVWDAGRQRLILGRDRLGKKPLYYWAGGGLFVFASEIKGILAHPAVPRELDPQALPAYVTFGYVPTPRTFFAGIRSLPPGHVLTVAPGQAPLVERYWEPKVPGVDGVPRMDLGMDDAAAQVRRHLSDAVRRRLVSDVPLGAFLSGGLDSSAVVATAAQETEGPLATFTIGFDDTEGFDERPYARLMAKRYGTDHHELVVRPDAVDLIERLVWHHDQPFGDSSALPTYLLNQFTRGHVTVALTGDGGDELFAGYERFLAGLAMRHYGRLPGVVRRSARVALHRIPSGALGGRMGSLQRFVRPTAVELPDPYLEWLSLLSAETRAAALAVPDGWAVEDFRRTWQRSAGAHPLDRLLDLNLRTYLVDDLLVKADRMSMAHGLEVRSPFLDTRLVEFALRLPPALKVRGLTLKRVVKRSLREMLPQEILERPKKGFGVPLDRWFREDLRSYVDATLGAADARVRRNLEPAVIDRLIAEHRGGASHGHALWMLLTLEVFLRQQGW